MASSSTDENPAQSESSRRGRPRSAACDEAILTAAWRLLDEVGYTRMSMEGIARAAGVGKPTLYLRYADKAEVAAAAFMRQRIQRAPVPAGDLRADIAAQLDHVRTVMMGSGMRLLGTCLVEEDRMPHLIDLLRERSTHPGRAVLRGILEQGISRGEVDPDADIDTAVSMAIGAFYSTRIGGRPFPPDWAERVADAVIRMVAPRMA